jgi:hypothetical protein
LEETLETNIYQELVVQDDPAPILDRIGRFSPLDYPDDVVLR